MATLANIFSLKLDNKDFNAQLQTAAKAAQDYDSKIANSLLEAAKGEARLVTLLREKSDLQAQGNKEALAGKNREIAATKTLIQAENASAAESKRRITISVASATEAISKNKQWTESINAKARAEAAAAEAAVADAKRVADLRSSFSRTYESTPSQNKYNDSLAQLNSLRSEGVISQKQYNSALAQETELLKRGGPERDNQFNHLIRMMRWAGTLAGAYYAVKTAWGATLGKGIELGRQIEDMGMGISALTSANADNVSSTSRVLTGYEKFQLASRVTVDTMKQLRKAALDTPASFSEMAMIFQQAYVSTSAMGKGFGDTTTEVIKNTVKLSTNMANIAGAIGMPMQKALEETRSLMSGQASGDSLIASLLFGSPAQANEAMRRAKAAGPGAVKALMDEVMASYEVLAGVDTYTKSLAQAQGAYENLVTRLSAPIKNEMKDAFDAIAKALSDDNITEAAETFSALGDAIKRLAEATGIAVGVLATVKGVLYISAASQYATAILGAAGATDALTAATNRNAMAMRKHPLAKMLGVVSALGDAQSQMEQETKGKWKITSLTQEKQVISQLTSEMTKLAELQRDIGKRTVSHPFKITKEDVATQKALVRNLMDSVTAYNTKASSKKTVAETLKQSDIDPNIAKDIVSDYSKSAEAIKSDLETKIRGYRETVVKLEAKIANPLTTGKAREAAIGLRHQAEVAIARAEAELEKPITKASKAAEAAATKRNREGVKAYELEKQRIETAIAMADAATVQKEVADKVDVNALHEKFKLQFALFDQERVMRDSKIKEAKEADTNESTRKNTIQKIQEEYAKKVMEFGKWELSQQEKINAEIEKGIKAADRLSLKQLNLQLHNIVSGTKTLGEETEFERTFGKGKIPRSEANSAIGEAQAALLSKVFSSGEELAQAEKNTADAIDRIKAQIIDLPPLVLEVQFKGWDKMSEGFAQILNSIQAVTKESKRSAFIQAEVQAKRKGTEVEYAAFRSKNSRSYKKEQLEDKAYSYQTAQAQMQNYANIAGAFGSLMRENSKEQQAAQAVQMALNASMMMSNALTAISGAAIGVGPMGLITAAAMVAFLGSMGIFKGSASTSYDSLAGATANSGMGSTLGDTNAQSESIANSMSVLENLAKPEFALISQMNKSLISIDSKIAGVSSKIVQTGGFAIGEGYTSSGTTNPLLKAFDAWGLDNGLGSSNELGAMLKKLDIGGSIVNSVVAGILGGGSSTELQDAGISFSSQLINSAIVGLEGQSYQMTKTVEDGGWFSRDETSYNSYFAQMDEYTRKQFSLVLGGLYDATVLAGEGLGVSTGTIESELSDFVVNLGKISLKDKTGEEIQKTLTSVFGKVGDELATEAFPALAPFQQIGEGLFETMTRVATGMEEAGYYVDRLGNRFSDLNFTDIIDQSGDVGVEALRQSIIAFEETTYGAANGVIGILDTLSGSTQELYDTYTALGDIRIQIDAMGQSAGNLSAPMIRGAGSLDELSKGLTSYFENYLSESDQIISKTKTLGQEFANLGLVLPRSTAGFKDLVRGIDTATAAGAELYGQVLTLADSFYTLKNASESNMASFANGLLTSEHLTQEMANQAGVTIATTAVELGDMFNQLSNDADGLTDSDLALIEANKSLLLNSTELNKSLTATSGSISALKGVLETITQTIDKLRTASGGADYTMTMFRTSMTKAMSLKGSTDYVGFSEAVKAAANYSSVLLDENAIPIARDRRFAQAVAANQFAELGDITKTELSVLEQIERNTSDQILAITMAMDALGMSINSQLTSVIATRSPSGQATPIDSSITTAYASILGRTPESVGGSYWSSQLSSGALNTASVDDEIAKAAIPEIYRALLGREPDAAGAAYWADKLSSGQLAPDQIDDAIRAAAIANGQQIMPGFAVGSPYVPRDMNARIHQGEIIAPKTMSDGIRAGELYLGKNNNSELVDAMNRNISATNAIITVMTESRDIQNASLVQLEYIAEVS